MIYSKHISTEKFPATSVGNPQKTELFITKGLIYRVELFFPSGSGGLLGVAIFDGNYQVWPSTLGEWFTGDGNTIAFEDIYLKNEAPFLFKIKTYNNDDTYDHVVDVRLGQVSKEIYMARFLPSLSAKFLQQAIFVANEVQQKSVQAQKLQTINNPFSRLTY